MPRAKRALEEVDPNVETNSPKSSKANDGRRRSGRTSSTLADSNESPGAAKKAGNRSSIADNRGNPTDGKGEKATGRGKTGSGGGTTRTGGGKNTPAKGKTAEGGSPRATNKTKENEMKTGEEEQDTATTTKTDDNSKSGKRKGKDKSAGNKKASENLADRPRYDYIVGQPPIWDWEDQHRGHDEDKMMDSYGKMLDKLQPDLFKPIEEKPNHKWPLMPGTLLQYVDGIYASNNRNPDMFNMYIYNDYQGYGLHEVVENFLLDYNKEFVKKEKDQNLKEMWVILSGLVHYLKAHGAIEYLFGNIDDGERACDALKLIGVAFLSLLDVLERAEHLKSNSEFKDLAIVMSMYLIWAQEWDADTWNESTQWWDVKILKYAQDHKIDLTKAPPKLAASTVKNIKPRAQKQKAWPKAGADRWGFKKALQNHEQHGKGGQGMDITKWTRAERKKYSFDKKDPLADVPDKALRDGEVLIGTIC